MLALLWRFIQKYDLAEGDESVGLTDALLAWVKPRTDLAPRAEKGLAGGKDVSNFTTSWKVTPLGWVLGRAHHQHSGRMVWLSSLLSTASAQERLT